MFLQSLFCSWFLSSFFRKGCTNNSSRKPEEAEVFLGSSHSSGLSDEWSYQKLDKDKLRMSCRMKEAKSLANFCPISCINSLGQECHFPLYSAQDRYCYCPCALLQCTLCQCYQQQKSGSCRRCTRPLNAACFAQVILTLLKSVLLISI